MKVKLLLLAVTSLLTSQVCASLADHNHTSTSASLSKSGNRICMSSDGLPDHATGTFPNRGNPNSIRQQNFRFCVPANPRKSSSPDYRNARVTGFILNGVIIRPGTADFYDPQSRRGFSRNPASGWRLDGMGAAQLLGMDHNNAHTDPRGIYHYHGKPVGFLNGNSDSHIGYAADGFEIHYVGSQVRSGYRLKTGVRPGGPGGQYDGTYVQDWQYVGGRGTLDECNGGMLNGKFVYFVTETYPHYPRCLWGEVSNDFRRL